MRENHKTSAPAIDNAVAIVELVAMSPLPLTLTDICQQTGISPSTAHRVINSLLHHEMLSTDPRKKRSYSVGSRVFEVASTVLSKQSLIPFFYPLAEILKNEVHQTIFLSVPIGKQMVVISKVEPAVSNTYEIYTGQTVNMHLSAAGKVLLAMHTEGFQANYFALEAVAEQLNAAAREEVFADLQRSARLGYAVSHGDFEGGVSTMAAPVMNLNNEPVASVGIAIKSAHFDSGEARQYSKNLVQAARQLSSRIV